MGQRVGICLKINCLFFIPYPLPDILKALFFRLSVPRIVLRSNQLPSSHLRNSDYGNLLQIPRNVHFSQALQYGSNTIIKEMFLKKQKGKIFLDWLVIGNVHHCLPFDVYRVRRQFQIWKRGQGCHSPFTKSPFVFSSEILYSLSYLRSCDHFTFTSQSAYFPVKIMFENLLQFCNNFLLETKQ